MVEQAIYDILSGEESLTAIVGENIYPHIADQDVTLPCVLYSLVTSSNMPNFNGCADVQSGTVQISIFASTFLQCLQIKDIVYSAFISLNDSTVNDSIKAVATINESEGYNYQSGQDTLTNYTKTLDINILYQ